MRFGITLTSSIRHTIPMNYQYPLSAAIYKIIAKGDAEYASFLHETGYGKGFKLFCFSDLRGKFKVNGDSLIMQDSKVSFEISFHLPAASQNFVKGLFLSQTLEIAHKRSRAVFTVSSVEALPNPFAGRKDSEIIQAYFQPASAVVAGIKNEKGNYTFLSPDDPRFAEILLFNWKEKIKSVFEESVEDKILYVEIMALPKPPKSRLITVKAGTPAETKIRGWLNFGLRVTGEKRFVELLWNTGAGIYNSTTGMIEYINTKAQ